MDIMPGDIENNRILIVDDNEAIHEDIKKIIKSEPSKEKIEISNLENILFDKKISAENTPDKIKIDYLIEDAYQGEEAVMMVQKAEAKNRQYALIFMDVRMPPGINGIESVERIWKINPFIEIVICTAFSDYTWEEIVKKVGCAERLLFVKKPFNSLEIKQVVLSLVLKRNLNEKARNMIKVMENEMEERTNQLQSMVTELKKSSADKQNKEPSASELPERDSLTRLYNLFVLQQRLQEIFEASRRHSFPLSVLIIDIDNFKELNDTYGHDTGNEVLLKVAEILKGSPYVPGQPYDEKENIGEIRKYDIAGRYGSDEFGVVLPYCGEESAKKIAGRLLQRIQSLKLISAPEAVIKGNCGIAVLDKDTACQNSRQVLSLADKALYYAKSQGKNRMHVIKYA